MTKCVSVTSMKVCHLHLLGIGLEACTRAHPQAGLRLKLAHTARQASNESQVMAKS